MGWPCLTGGFGSRIWGRRLWSREAAAEESCVAYLPACLWCTQGMPLSLNGVLRIMKQMDWGESAGVWV